MRVHRSAMWFRIIYINTVLYVCFVNASIQDSKHKDRTNNKQIATLDLSTLMVRLVSCSSRDNSSYPAVQVRHGGKWYPLCDGPYLNQQPTEDDGNANEKKTTRDAICTRARSSYTDNATVFGVMSAVTDPSPSSWFTKLRCNANQPCTAELTTNCSSGGHHLKEICSPKTKTVGTTYYPLSGCSYQGHTVTNCSGHANLWMTYEHAFFHRDLPETFIAWTSSYLKRSSCNQTDAKRCIQGGNATNATSEVECINYCLNPASSGVSATLEAAAYESHTNTCTCFTTSHLCSKGQSQCAGDLYQVTTSKRHPIGGEGSNLSELCIAVQRSDNTSVFTARKCSYLLPQLCGSHKCYPIHRCKNGALCEISRDYQDFTCKEKNDTKPDKLPPAIDMTTPLLQAQPTPSTWWWIVAGVVVTFVLLVAVFVVVCLVSCKRRPPGESQRSNSMVNRTYGESTHASHYEHIDDDDTYDLLDEHAMNPGPRQEPLNRGVLLLDDYSTPNDVIIDSKRNGDVMTEYATTYDDPIRKLSDHEDAVQLNIGQLLAGPDKLKGQQQGGDIEMRSLKHVVPEFPEPMSRESSEGGSKKNSFKGCLCSMNASAESDIETSGQLPKPRCEDKCSSGDDIKCKSTHIHIETEPTLIDASDDSSHASIKVGSVSGESAPSNYFTLAPSPLKLAPPPPGLQGRNKEYNSRTDERGLAKETDVDSDYEDTTGVAAKTSSSGECDKTKRFLQTFSIRQPPPRDHDVRGDSDGSDYEDTSVVDSQQGRARHVTMPGQGRDCCLHSPPEVLMERLGIRIVPSSFTYETYMALPKSRADFMNPYYSNFIDISGAPDSAVNNGELGTSYVSRDNSREFDRLRLPEVNEASVTLQGEVGSSENEYDRLYRIKKSVHNQNSQYSYDHVMGSWNKSNARKRLNSY